jgi:O-antigen/teichoic acid export membrane protein
MKRNFSHLALVTFLGGLLGRGFRYLINVVIARGLGTEALGVFAFGLVVLKASMVISRFGLDNAAMKFIPVYRERGEDGRLVATVLICMSVPVVIGSGIALGLYLQLPTLAAVFEYSFTDSLGLFLFGIPLLAAMFVAMKATRAFKRTRPAVVIRDIGQSGAALVLVVVGAFILSDLSVVIIGYLVSIVVGLSLSLLFLRRLLPRVRPEIKIADSRRLVSFAIPATLIAVSQYLISWTDIVMLSAFLEARQVGLYQAAYQTSMLLLVVLGAANSIFPTLVSEFQETGDMQSLQRLYAGVTKWVMYFTVAGCIFLIVFRGEVLTLFDTTARSARVALAVLAVGQTVSAVTGPVGFLLTMSGYERVESMNTISVAILNVILNYWLILQYGLLGAAVATAASFTFLNVLRLAEVRLLIGFNPFHRSYLTGVPALLAAVGVIIMGKFLAAGTFYAAIIVGFLSLCSFGATYYFIEFDEIDEVLFESL